MKRVGTLVWGVLWLVLVVLLSPDAHAFCGFFVSGASGSRINDATQVALMRDGTRTVLSMRNSYRGPPEDFALVVPVPVVLQKENVRTLPVALFDRLDQLTAPRLVEYWEQDPCPWGEEEEPSAKEGGTGTRAKGEEGSLGTPTRPTVRVEAEFSVDEYDVVILSADDSTGLEAWLREHRYRLPDGIEPFLRPYVVSGSKFFVARVDTKRVRFLWGRAVLSPLRFHYDTEQFSLPIRLGLANASGPQDLVVYTLSPAGHRYEVANYDNVFIPTNLEVRDEARLQFPSFYATLFDRTVAGQPRAVVTEYAWSTGSCDPCPVPPLQDADLAQLGLDAMSGSRRSDLTVTRLHARYGRETLGEDFVFRPAPAVAGGNESWSRGGSVHNATTPQPSSTNSFQSRTILRHPWQGVVACANPSFGRWGGPPDGLPPRSAPPSAATPVRRDLPIDRLIVARAPTGADRARSAPAADARPLGQRLIDWIQRSHQHYLPLFGVLLLAELITVLLVARRTGAGMLRHGALAIALVVGPLLALLGSPRWQRLLSEVGLKGTTLSLYTVAVTTLLVLHCLARAGRRVPAWQRAQAALLPLVAALLDQGWSLLRMSSIVSEVSSDEATRALVVVSVESEMLSGMVLGAMLSGLLLLQSAWWVSELPPEQRVTEGRPGQSVVATLVALAVVVALLASSHSGWQPTSLPAALGVLLSGAAAFRLARRWPHAATANPAPSPLIRTFSTARAQALLLGSLAAVLLASVPLLAAHRTGLNTMLSSTLTADQLQQGLVDLSHTLRDLGLRWPLLALAVLAPLAVALRPARDAASWRESGHEERTSWRVGGATIGLAVALFFLQRHEILAHIETSTPAGDRRLQALPLVLAAAPLTSSNHRDAMASLAGPLLAIDAKGQLLGSPSTADLARPLDDVLLARMGEPRGDLGAPSIPLLAVDRTHTLGTLRAALAPLLSRRQTSVRWMTGSPLHSSSVLQTYSPLVTTRKPVRAFQAELLDTLTVREPRPQEPLNRRVLAVQPSADQLIVKTMSGGLGSYLRHPGEPAWTYSRARFEDELRSKEPPALAQARLSTEEILLIVPDTTSVESIGELLTRLSQLPRVRGRAGDIQPRDAKFVISSDPSLLGSP